MKNHYFYFMIFLWAQTILYASDFKSIILNPSYDHTKYAPQSSGEDTLFHFRAYTTCFDLGDDDTDDGVPDTLGVPQWVAYELKRYSGTLGNVPQGPSEWITDRNFNDDYLAPSHDSYHFSNVWRADHPDSPQLGYNRGHMCMNHHAWRLGAEAAWNTFTVMNCCPQKVDLNQGIWKDLEEKTADWADAYQSVWILTGPVFYKNKQIHWLGQQGEVPSAIPDAFFKIVIREINGQPEVLALYTRSRVSTTEEVIMTTPLI